MSAKRMLHRFLASILAVFVGLVAASGPASAHPHVWVIMTSQLLYASDGSVTGIRHAWKFDEMYSAFATQGLETKVKGQFTRDELKPLAQVNVESLKEYEYFTYAKVDGKRHRSAFRDPVDYWLDYDPKETVLTLHFTLPLKKPVKTKSLELEIYDPEFFVDFGFAEKNPVTLVSAPAQCAVTVAKPNELDVPAVLRLDKSFMASEANAGMGASFANKVSVKCP
jgi:ABC-type uncharacterized transport system substrate-binding protein